jgi:hypothetical protein
MSTASLCVCAASIALAITFMCVIMCSLETGSHY